MRPPAVKLHRGCPDISSKAATRWLSAAATNASPLATTGLLVQFGLQAIINMASTLQLIPTKGMTLPFISYGGSSYLALGMGMGMVLALTRRRPGAGALR